MSDTLACALNLTRTLFRMPHDLLPRKYSVKNATSPYLDRTPFSGPVPELVSGGL